MINRNVAIVCLPMVPVCPVVHPMVISPDSECIIEMGILSSWQNHHIGSLTCGIRAIMVGTAKIEAIITACI